MEKKWETIKQNHAHWAEWPHHQEEIAFMPVSESHVAGENSAVSVKIAAHHGLEN